MVKLYVKRIQNKQMTFDMVPDKWKEQVREVLAAEAQDGDEYRPISFETGMYIESGMFYTDGNNVYEAVVTGKADEFGEPWFDVE